MWIVRLTIELLIHTHTHSQPMYQSRSVYAIHLSHIIFNSFESNHSSEIEIHTKIDTNDRDTQPLVYLNANWILGGNTLNSAFTQNLMRINFSYSKWFCCYFFFLSFFLSFYVTYYMSISKENITYGTQLHELNTLSGCCICWLIQIIHLCVFGNHIGT